MRHLVACIAALAQGGCLGTHVHKDDARDLSIMSLQIEPELVVVHSGRSVKLHAVVPDTVETRLRWSVRDSAGEEIPCAGSVDNAGTFTAGATLGRFYYVHATDISNPAISAIARVEIVANPEPDPSRSAPPSWRSKDHGLFTLRYPAELAADERHVSSVILDVAAVLDELFAGHGSPWAEEQFLLTVYVYPHSTDKAAPGQATLVTQRRDGESLADLHLLAPSRHCGGTTGKGDPFGADYLHKLITHELSTLYLDEITRIKESGWMFFDAPEWFVQGYEEYIARNHPTNRAREVTKEDYLRRSSSHPSRVSLGILTRDAYVDGAVLLTFLHEKYSVDAVRNVLASNQPSFWLAVENVLGLGPESLLDEFNSWIVDPISRRDTPAPD